MRETDGTKVYAKYGRRRGEAEASSIDPSARKSSAILGDLIVEGVSTTCVLEDFSYF